MSDTDLGSENSTVELLRLWNLCYLPQAYPELLDIPCFSHLSLFYLEILSSCDCTYPFHSRCMRAQYFVIRYFSLSGIPLGLCMHLLLPHTIARWYKEQSHPPTLLSSFLLPITVVSSISLMQVFSCFGIIYSWYSLIVNNFHVKIFLIVGFLYLVWYSKGTGQ